MALSTKMEINFEISLIRGLHKKNKYTLLYDIIMYDTDILNILAFACYISCEKSYTNIY